MSEPGSAYTPAGWYPDPSTPGTQRYWDGVAWTNSVMPAAYPYGMRTETSTYAILAIVFAFVFFPLGIVFGVMGRREIDESGGTKTGRGLATAGMWIGIAHVIFIACFFLFLIFAIGIAGVAGGN
jgi:hypothetical protein